MNHEPTLAKVQLTDGLGPADEVQPLVERLLAEVETMRRLLVNGGTEAAARDAEMERLRGAMREAQPFCMTFGAEILRNALGPYCMCKDRALSECPGEWEPGCDLGANPAHARVTGK